MAVLKNLSFRTKIFLYASIISSVSLVLACSAFILYDNYSYRESIERDVTTQADILGITSASALVF